MAFVSESRLPDTMAVRTGANNVGPGQYDVDSLQHKQLMAAIYPKKSAPFNSTEKRSKEVPQKSVSPGKLSCLKTAAIPLQIRRCLLRSVLNK